MASTIYRPDVRVLGVGLPRTGTLSLKAALEMLGFGPCNHMNDLMVFHHEHLGMWTEVSKGNNPIQNIYKIYEEGGYKSGVDYPGSQFPEELYKAFPDAKFILSVRDPEKWKLSWDNTLRRMIINHLWLPSLLRASKFAYDFRETYAEDVVWQKQFGGDWDTNAIRVFHEHNDLCKKIIPEDQLLVFEVGEGWERLCKFLDIPVPDEEFPKLNDASAFNTSRLAFASFSFPSAVLYSLSLNFYHLWMWFASFYNFKPSAKKD